MTVTIVTGRIFLTKKKNNNNNKEKNETEFKKNILAC